MPTTRRAVNRPVRDLLTPEAVRCWREGDFHGLARAVGIKPWQMHPWPLEISALGCDPDAPPADRSSPRGASWERAVALQRALYEAAGEPGKVK